MGVVRLLIFPVPSFLTCVRFPVWILSLLPPLLFSGLEGSPPLSSVCPAQVARYDVWGVLSPPLPVWGVSPLPLPLLQIVCRERALLLGRCHPLLRPLDTRWGSPLPGQWGVPFSSPLVDARVKRALPFGGSSILWLAARDVCTLPVLFPRPHLPPAGPPCPRGVLGDFPADLGPCGGWVTRRLLQHQ